MFSEAGVLTLSCESQRAEPIEKNPWGDLEEEEDDESSEEEENERDEMVSAPQSMQQMWTVPPNTWPL